MFKPVDLNINFPEMEKRWLKLWYEKGVVKKYLQKNSKAKKTFSFLDGPITANNPMGVHHAWGRTYKDLWPKFYNLLGYRQRFQNGFDCQGLWVEVEVEKELSLKSKKDIENLVPGNRKASIAKFVELCKQRVYKYSKIQTEQSKRLGYFADWDNSYYTMSDENNYMIWHFLKTCFENGWIYKGKDSVPWCPRCETAISQHEMLTEDYKELTHETVFFKLPILNRDFSLIAWTTTPWTIPANVALAINPNYSYRIWEFKEEKIVIVAPQHIKKGDVFDTEQFEWYEENVMEAGFKGIKDIAGKDLLGLKYRGPFDDLPRVQQARLENHRTFHSVIAAEDLVTATKGTGILHVAPGAGQEDFQLAKKENLPVISVIGDNADYLQDMGDFSGKNAKKHPEIIIDYLINKEDGKYLLKTKPYKHRYPACWRCKTELVWKVEDEWYIAMDKSPLRTQSSKSKAQSVKSGKTLRQRMVDVAKKIRWMPEFGLDRELDWLKNMHDWLISKKNRYWGLALPIYECKKCWKFEVLGSKEELKERAVHGWDVFDDHTPHKPYIDVVKIKCSNCGSVVSRIDDVGNPWLDAGIVPYSTITEDNKGKPLYFKSKKDWKQWFPVDFITESFPGQFKNWFYALIAESTVLENTNPFKTVLGFGTLLGEDGRPMHKSWGNSIEFNEGADKIGVDVMRWMYSRQNPSDNMLFGYKKADEVRRQFYLILWNVYKFFAEYANLDKFKTQNSKLKATTQNSKVNILDQWILIKFSQLVLFVEKSLRNCNAKDAALEIEKFVSDLSTWYIRRSRDRVWVNSADKKDKDNFYSTLHFVLVNLSIVLSPFMPFISEEMFTNLTGEASAHLAGWPQISSKLKVQSSKLMEDMNLVRRIVEAGHARRKELKIKVRQPLASITISLSNPLTGKLELEKLIRDELNIKKIVWRKSKIEGIRLEYDSKITPDLEEEGRLRDLIRQIQQQRKQLGLKADQSVELVIPPEFNKYSAWIQKKVLAKHVATGPQLKVSQ